MCLLRPACDPQYFLQIEKQIEHVFLPGMIGETTPEFQLKLGPDIYLNPIP